MTEPTRWLMDEAVAPSMRRVLAAGTREIRFPDDVRKRVATRLVALTGATLATASATHVAHGATSAGATATGTAVGGVKGMAVVISLALGSAVVGAAVVEARQPSAPFATSEIASALVDRAEMNGGATTLPTDAFALRPFGKMPWTLDELPDATPSEARRGNRSVTPSGTQRDSFEDEVNALREARGALHTAPARALELLHSYERRFASGQLMAEARLLEVQALLALGRNTEAEAIGRRLLSNESARLYHDRVRTLLGKK